MKNNYTTPLAWRAGILLPVIIFVLPGFYSGIMAQDAIQVNTRPTLQEISNQVTKSTGDGRFVSITGITPGNEPDQAVSVGVECKSEILEHIEVHPTSNGNAIIQYLPKKGASGIALVTVTVTDNAPVPASVSRTFSIIVNKVGTAALPEAVTVPARNTFILRAHPNPSYSATRITFKTDEAEENAQLEVYSVSGAKLQNLFNGKTEAGRTYNLSFSRKDLPSGTYLLKLTTAKETKTLQVVLSK
ncbi:MAG: T9SS type A sorting domain-containing protein [Chitinophagaceae bacterium]|nr:T9SS type A sorting domain-containing protein [Chitinophagaceae bacterium]